MSFEKDVMATAPERSSSGRGRALFYVQTRGNALLRAIKTLFTGRESGPQKQRAVRCFFTKQDMHENSAFPFSHEDNEDDRKKGSMLPQKCCTLPWLGLMRRNFLD